MKPKHTPGKWGVDSDAIVAKPDGEHGDWLVIAIMPAPSDMIDDRNNGAAWSHNARLMAAAPELYNLLDRINAAFYTRTSRKEWLALMEETKPLLQKARGE